MAAQAKFNLLRQQGQSSLSLPSGSYIYSLCETGGHALAAISSDNSLRRFDRRTLELLSDGVISDTHSGPNGGVTGLCAVDGGSNGSAAVMATCGRDGTVKLWDSRTESRKATSTFSTGKDVDEPFFSFFFPFSFYLWPLIASRLSSSPSCAV